MTGESIYTFLSKYTADSGCNAFDGHVLACIFTVAAMESSPARPLTHALGVPERILRRASEQYFPGAQSLLESFGLDGDPVVDENERCLRELLGRSRTAAGPLGSLLAMLIARRCERPNHLWQDLGLPNRADLSRLMLRHFAPLALRNTQDMKWKKFFFRMICRDEGFSLCAAPSCSECGDFGDCFGDESGESLLARTRLRYETQGLISISPVYAQ